eukprot:12902936-Prorocentrum_lima.AAC.1
MAPGNGDCGEDTSSILWVDNVGSPYDFGAPACLVQDYSLDLMDFHPTHEAYLAQLESECCETNPFDS